MFPIVPSSGSLNYQLNYQIQKSLRFRSSASAYLSRVVASYGNLKTFTFSGWVKRGSIGTGVSQGVFMTASDTNNYFNVMFNTNDTLRVASVQGGVAQADLVTSGVFRDPSAWYHIFVAIDTTQATASNRCLVYVNGVSQTLSGTSVVLNSDILGEQVKERD